jgi:hypothetical protein
MISGVPLFRGRDNQDQLLHIMRIIGSPDDRTLRKISADSVRSIVMAPSPLTLTMARSPKSSSSNSQGTRRYHSSRCFRRLHHRVGSPLILEPKILICRQRLTCWNAYCSSIPLSVSPPPKPLTHPYFTTANPTPGYPVPTPTSMPPPAYNYSAQQLSSSSNNTNNNSNSNNNKSSSQPTHTLCICKRPCTRWDSHKRVCHPQVTTPTKLDSMLGDDPSYETNCRPTMAAISSLRYPSYAFRCQCIYPPKLLVR